MMGRTFTIEISRENGMIWGEVVELPGVFASAETWDELGEAITEAISMALEDDSGPAFAFAQLPSKTSLTPTKAELSFA
ncbi:MAG: hypothetical protein E6Q27_05120 [Aeromicrobium sp.]|nr:MAG: hypothetical protein E6Q27_05120 [Aeromicrobium sp.]